MQQLDQARTVSAVQSAGPGLWPLPGSRALHAAHSGSTGQVPGGGRPLHSLSPGRQGDIHGLQPSGTNIHHDGISCHSPAHQQHSGEQALPQPTTSEYHPLCHFGQWSTHPAIQRNEHHHHGKPQQGLQDCQRKGCEPRPWPWNNAGRRVPRQWTHLHSSCDPCRGWRGRHDSLPLHAGLCQNDLQITGTEPETPVALARLTHCAHQPGLHRPLPGLQEGRPVSPLAHGHHSDNALLSIGSQDPVICSRRDYLIHLWKFCKPLSLVSPSTGQDYFGYCPRCDFTATNGFIVGLLLLCGDIETHPGPVAIYSGISELQESIKLRGLKMAHQNIQSLSCKVDQLCIWLRNDLKNGLQTWTLSETWAKRDLSDGEFGIPGYKLFRKGRDGRNGGIVAYVRDDILVTRRDDLEIDSVEGLWLEIVVTKLRNFLLGTFCGPDSSSQYYDNQFMTKLDIILACAAVQGKETILTGDFNCCFMSSKCNSPDSEQLKSLFKSMSFKQLIASPARMVKDFASLIDLIATNCPQNISNFRVVSLHLSDHELVSYSKIILAKSSCSNENI